MSTIASGIRRRSERLRMSADFTNSCNALPISDPEFHVSIGKPGCDPLRTVADDFAGLRLEHIHAVHFHTNLAVRLRKERDVRFAKDHEEIGLAGVFLRFSAMCRSAFIRALSTGMRPNMINSVVRAS